MERTIKVTGKGKISVKPDTIRLTITQTALYPVYEKAIKDSADKKEFLNNELKGLGFEKSELKTLHYNVDSEYESYQDKNNNWKRRFSGYKYTHRMKLEFASDNALLGKVLSIVSRCPGEPEFSIQYTISDAEAAKNELLAKAVEDSKIKANVLSTAAGVSLKEIMTIDYSWGEIDFVTRPVNELMMRSCIDSELAEESINFDIEADDIDVTDTVTVVWSIE
ncbi:MAG: SIMPL domain-containing protein [Oscillospiraceae bacterium]|nr:SIMPL domain-containing protein [Oscillospiraceae bacterium]